jgi:hypothetical protein
MLARWGVSGRWSPSMPLTGFQTARYGSKFETKPSFLARLCQRRAGAQLRSVKLFTHDLLSIVRKVYATVGSIKLVFVLR